MACRDGWRDVAEGAAGVAVMVAALLTPFDRGERGRWGAGAQAAAGRGGFYSYQWLENLIGCRVCNATAIHPEWAARQGGELRLHPKAPPLRIVTLQPGRALVAYMPPAPTLSAASQGESPRPDATSGPTPLAPRDLCLYRADADSPPDQAGAAHCGHDRYLARGRDRVLAG